MRDRVRAVFGAGLAQDQGDVMPLFGLRVGQLDRMPLGTGEAPGEQDMGDGKRRGGGHAESVA